MRKVSYRKLQSVNVVSLNEDLAAPELRQNLSDDLRELVSSYNNTLMTALDKHSLLMMFQSRDQGGEASTKEGLKEVEEFSIGLRSCCFQSKT